MKPGDLLAAKYRLEGVLGSGGMGEVWAAVNESTGRPVAIKLMQMSTPALRARMLREGRAMGTLKHRNIVDIHDVGETVDGDPFLVMERLSGETLADRLERVGSLSPATAVEIAGAIAAALRLAHAKGIVHRDLKPANVFLHREGEHDGGREGEIVKVLDFGVSKHLRETTGTTTSGLLGSPAYMSPEQAEEASVDARSDLWSFGVVLFQMLAGRRPFPATSPYVVITEVVSGPIPSIAAAVPGLSPTLVHVVERCLTRDVDARMASADELIRLLGSSGGVYPPSTDGLPGRRGAVPPSTEPTAKELEGWARRPSSPALAAVTPRVLVGAAAATIVTGERARLGKVPMNGPSNAVVALIAAAAALLLIGVCGMAVRRAPTAAASATSVAAKQPRVATDGVVPSISELAVARAAEAPAKSEPTTVPQVGKDAASAATSVAVDDKPIGAVPAAPVVVPAGSGSAHFRAPSRTHPSGEKRLLLP